MATSRDIKVRKAGVDDYQAVMDINRNVYGGLDYMTNLYHPLVTNPDNTFYVCVVDGEIVALEGVAVLDDNQTLMMRSLRVKAEFQGQGLLAIMRKKIYEDFKDMPGEKRVRSACDGSASCILSARFRSQNKTLLVEKAIRFLDIDASQMMPVSGNVEEAKQISHDEFRCLLQNDVIKNYLYPHNIISSDYWFYDALPSNVRHFKLRNGKIIVTKHLYKYLPPHPTEEVCGASQVSEKGGNRQNSCVGGLLAIVTGYFAASEFYMVVNVAGRPEEGKEIDVITSLLQQAIAYMQLLTTDSPNDLKVVLRLVYSQGLTKELFLDAAKSFGLIPTTLENTMEEQYYFEQEFEYLIK